MTCMCVLLLQALAIGLSCFLARAIDKEIKLTDID